MARPSHRQTYRSHQMSSITAHHVTSSSSIGWNDVHIKIRQLFFLKWSKSLVKVEMDIIIKVKRELWKYINEPELHHQVGWRCTPAAHTIRIYIGHFYIYIFPALEYCILDIPCSYVGCCCCSRSMEMFLIYLFRHLMLGCIILEIQSPCCCCCSWIF